jgi:hypothetical protein
LRKRLLRSLAVAARPGAVRWRRGLGIGEAVNDRRRGGFLTGRGGQTEALRGAATVAPSFRLVVEREQQGRWASVWDDECGGSVDRRVAHRWAEFSRCGRGATTRQRRRKGVETVTWPGCGSSSTGCAAREAGMLWTGAGASFRPWRHARLWTSAAVSTTASGNGDDGRAWGVSGVRSRGGREGAAGATARSWPDFFLCRQGVAALGEVTRWRPRSAGGNGGRFGWGRLDSDGPGLPCGGD